MRRRATQAIWEQGDTRGHDRVVRRAWTLIETLAVVGVLGVLLAILIPALRSARITALETAVLAHQGQVGAELRRYVTDHKDAFPFYGVPGTLRARLGYYPLREGRGPGEYRDPDGYWLQPYFWCWVLIGEGYGGELARSGPEVADDWWVHERYVEGIALDWLAGGAFARPTFFRTEDPQFLADHQPQRASLVRHPSLKGALIRWSYAREGIGTRAFITFFDGHTERVDPGDLRPAAFIRADPGAVPVVTTEMGLEGRDK